MPINSRNKGAAAERELANILRAYGWDAKRGCQFQGSKDSPDVRHNIPGLHIECKRVEKLNLRAAYQQACDDAGDMTPVVMHRANRQPWMVTLALKDYLDTLAAVRAHQPQPINTQVTPSEKAFLSNAAPRGGTWEGR